MLQSIRNQARSWVVFILFGLLILSFAIWGIGDIFRPGVSGQTTVASVGNTDISAQAYLNDLRRELSQIQRAQGMTLDLSQARQFGIASRVLRQMVNNALLTQGANDLGIGMSTATIADHWRGAACSPPSPRPSTSSPGSQAPTSSIDITQYRATFGRPLSSA